MASSSNANTRVSLLQEIDQMIEWTEIQYNFLDADMTDVLETIINPMFAKFINSTRNSEKIQKYIRDREKIRTFIIESRGHKEDTGLPEHIGYEKLLIDLKNLRRNILANSDINEIRERLKNLEKRYYTINFEFNKCLKLINKSMPGVIPRRIFSEHARLQNEITNFPFSTATKRRSRPINRSRSRSPTPAHNGTQRRGRSRNHSNVTHRARSRSRSAIRNEHRPRRGSIRINETARGSSTFHKNNVRNRLVVDPSNPLQLIIEPGMTQTTAEAKNKSDRGKNHAYTIHAAASAAETARKARLIVSTISHISPIFAIINTAADEADAAAREAAHYAEIFDESADDEAARQLAQRAITARDKANAALRQIKETIKSSPSAPAAAASSNPQNRT